MDVFVDRIGRAVAGFVILLFTSSFLPLGVRGTVAVAAILTFTCAMICMRLRKTYVNSFREQLKRREVDLGDVSGYVSDPAGVQLLVDTLEGANERQILYSLRLLQSARNVDFSRQLFPLLEHPSPYVREEAARTLPALPLDCTSRAELLLDDVSSGVRDAAVDYLCSGASESRLESLLNDPRTEVRVSAARWVFIPTRELVENMLSSDAAAAATLAARLPGDEGVELLRKLIKDPSPKVAEAAAIAAAQAGHVELVYSILDLLPVHRFRKGAREALRLYGERIVGTLGDVLRDAHRDPGVTARNGMGAGAHSSEAVSRNTAGEPRYAGYAASIPHC